MDDDDDNDDASGAKIPNTFPPDCELPNKPDWPERFDFEVSCSQHSPKSDFCPIWFQSEFNPDWTKIRIQSRLTKIGFQCEQQKETREMQDGSNPHAVFSRIQIRYCDFSADAPVPRDPISTGPLRRDKRRPAAATRNHGRNAKELEQF